MKLSLKTACLRNVLVVCATVLALVGFSASASAQPDIFNWDGDIDSQWDDTGNWGGPDDWPGFDTTDDVVIIEDPYRNPVLLDLDTGTIAIRFLTSGRALPIKQDVFQ